MKLRFRFLFLYSRLSEPLEHDQIRILYETGGRTMHFNLVFFSPQEKKEKNCRFTLYEIFQVFPISASTFFLLKS